MLKGKTVVLGVTGSIAAYKIANLASMLVKQHADVNVIMTHNATNFINPITFETLTGNKCLVDTFDRNFEFNVEHVALAKRADIFMVAPASANVIGKMANGIADDMLTTTILAAKCPKLVSPAMNTNMYENRIVQDNIKKLEHYGFEMIKPAEGYLACGDTGAGKMPEPQTLFNYIMRTIACEKDLAGKNVLITAGATQEKIDPVRFITNHSTGKMGRAIAENCMLRGAHVTLVNASVSVEPPMFVDVVNVTSAADMADVVKSKAAEQDIIIMTAAVADFCPSHPADEKIKKNDTVIVAPEELLTKLLRKGFRQDYIITVTPDEQDMVEGIKFETVPAYNTDKQFHPKENEWVGYIIELNGYRYYIAGDTDITEENRKVKCDVAFVPVGGTYTMSFEEAAQLINEIKPQVAVPIHYGSVVGTKQDAIDFIKLLNPTINGVILMK